MIIGIAGAKRSGKTTLATRLAAVFQLEHASFAAPIRDFVARFFEITLDGLEAAKEEPIAWLDGVTPRHMMQTLGTEWGRTLVHPELWIRRVMRLASVRGGAVVSDVRFPNEAEAIRGLGGIVIRVNRDGCGSADAHASEIPLPARLVDFEIANDSTPEAMTRRAAACVAQHFRLCQNTSAA